jgi:hypothetical protein
MRYHKAKFRKALKIFCMSNTDDEMIIKVTKILINFKPHENRAIDMRTTLKRRGGTTAAVLVPQYLFDRSAEINTRH